MYDQQPAITSPKVIHHAVRGHKTKDYGHLKEVTLGDAGLLANLLVVKLVSKTCEIGIVPHLWHIDNPVLPHLLLNHSNMKLIDVRLDPPEVIKQIVQCGFVLSSSLHGLIVADSLGVPNHWIQFDVPLFGGNWKFEDYYSVFNLRPKPLIIESATEINNVIADETKVHVRSNLQDVKKRLLNSFRF